VFKLEEWPIVWGVYLGQGCITGNDPLDWKELRAHAHNDKDEEWFGWICLADIKDAFTKLGNPSMVIKHEIAHLLAPNQGHTKKWKEILTAMGGASEVRKYDSKKNLIPNKDNNKLLIPISKEKNNGKQRNAPGSRVSPRTIYWNRSKSGFSPDLVQIGNSKPIFSSPRMDGGQGDESKGPGEFRASL